MGIYASNSIKNGTLLRAKKDIMASPYDEESFGHIGTKPILFLAKGECGVVDRLHIYKFVENGITDYYSQFYIHSDRCDGELLFSTKPSVGITPDIEEQFEIVG